MQTIDTIFASGPTDRAFRVKFNDGQVFVIDSVQRGQDPGEPPHAVANVVGMVITQSRKAGASKAERVAANGRPLERGSVSRELGFLLSTRVGYSRTGPGRSRIAFDSTVEAGRGGDGRQA